MSTSALPETQISVSSVVLRLDQLLPLLATGPYSTNTLADLATFCMEVKVVGPQVDSSHKDKMDVMQSLLTKICQDTQLNLELRLQVLEVIELRTLSWVSNPTVDNYYQERFAQFEERRKKDQERKEAKGTKNRGEKKRKLSQLTPSMSSMQEDKQSVNRQSSLGYTESAVSNSKSVTNLLGLQSSLPDTESPSMKYSRTEILSLATSPLAREAPLHWDKLVPKLPSVILQKSPGLKVDASEGCKQTEVKSSLPGSLPLMRNVGAGK